MIVFLDKVSHNVEMKIKKGSRPKLFLLNEDGQQIRVTNLFIIKISAKYLNKIVLILKKNISS